MCFDSAAYLRVPHNLTSARLGLLPSNRFAKAMYYGTVDRWVRFAASLEGLDSLVEEDRKIIESRIPNWKGDDKELRLIKLDRTWTYESGKDLVLYKLPRLPPAYKVYYKMSRTLKASVPIQVRLVRVEYHIIRSNQISGVFLFFFLFYLAVYAGDDSDVRQLCRHSSQAVPKLRR